MGARLQHLTQLAKPQQQLTGRIGLHIRPGVQPERCQSFGTLLTDAGDLAQRQGGDEGRHLIGSQHEQAIGLIQIRGDLG